MLLREAEIRKKHQNVLGEKKAEWEPLHALLVQGHFDVQRCRTVLQEALIFHQTFHLLPGSPCREMGSSHMLVFGGCNARGTCRHCSQELHPAPQL